MKLNEIVRVNPINTMIDSIINSTSTDIILLYTNVDNDSNHFSIPARQLYSVNDLADYMFRLRLIKPTIVADFGLHAQCRRALNQLLKYFSS